MKIRLTYILSTAIGLLLATSCRNDFIDLVPPTQITTATFYKTQADVDGRVNAAYGALQPMYSQMFLFSDVSTDNTFTSPEAIGTGMGDFDLLPLQPNVVFLANMWNNCYATIARCNIVLSRMPDITMNAELKSRYEGEMKFLRALAYFNLVRIWGEVPLVTSEVTDVNDLYSYGREPVDAVYNQIIQDLTDAEGRLPVNYNSANAGRATIGASKALLGKVYLTRKQYAEAAAKLKEVIDGGSYQLLPDYNDIFRANNGNNAEVIFAVQYVKGGLGEGSPFANNFATHNSISGNTIVAVGEAQGYSQITPDLANTFEEGDLRKTTSVGIVRESFFYTRKYIDVPAGPFDSDNDWIVIRYADVLLMYAEALNEQGNTGIALSYLNQVRNRAGLTEKQSTDPAEVKLALEQERRVELSMEGHRWFDLVRTERLIPVMNAYLNRYQIKRGDNIIQIEPYMLVFPVPFVEVQKNPDKITQNPGYSE